MVRCGQEILEKICGRTRNADMIATGAPTFGDHTMEALGTVLGIGWALCGVVAAAMHGSLALWRITIFLGPLAFFVFPPRD